MQRDQSASAVQIRETESKTDAVMSYVVLCCGSCLSHVGESAPGAKDVRSCRLSSSADRELDSGGVAIALSPVGDSAMATPPEPRSVYSSAPSLIHTSAVSESNDSRSKTRQHLHHCAQLRRRHRQTDRRGFRFFIFWRRFFHFGRIFTDICFTLTRNLTRN